MGIEISEEGYDRFFFDLSSKFAEPICATYGFLRYRLIAPLDPTEFNFRENAVTEVAIRVLITLALLVATATLVLPVTLLTLGIASKITRAIGYLLQKNNFTHIRGSASEKVLNGEAKIMTWNICGVAGGMHLDHGGVIDWPSRLDGIVNKILTEDADVVVLQEIYDTALSEALVERLQGRYAHLFCHLGANVMGGVGGLMVLSKCAVHQFTNTSFENNHWTLNRTFAALEIKASPEDQLPCARIIGTHLIHDDNSKRMVQVAQIVNSVASEKLALPTVLTGDLNLERDDPQEGQQLNEYLEHGYRGEEPTCTNELSRKWTQVQEKTPDQNIDYISLFKNHHPAVQLVDTRLSKAFDATFNTKTALSDHHAMVSTLRGLRVAG